MDYIWVAVAFSCGFLVKQLDLPPLIGYLAAGFGLHAIGVEPDNSLSTLADLGITLLLFTIGLKLDVKVLVEIGASKDIWPASIRRARARGHKSATPSSPDVRTVEEGG